MELLFTHSICSTSGKKWPAEKQPKDWDHVKRLTHMLFLAWNDKNPIEGVVYLGELVSPKKEDPDQDFYDFFEAFNGFGINREQKRIHNYFTDFEDGFVTVNRRGGKTLYLATLAVWLGIKGYTVYYATHNNDMVKYFNSYTSKAPPEWRPKSFPTSNTDKLRGLKIDYILCDESAIFEPKTWEAIEKYRSIVPECKQFGATSRL